MRHGRLRTRYGACERPGSGRRTKRVSKLRAAVERRSERADKRIARSSRIDNVDMRRYALDRLGAASGNRTPLTERYDDGQRIGRCSDRRAGKREACSRPAERRGKHCGFVLVDYQHIKLLQEVERKRMSGSGVEHDAGAEASGARDQ